MKKQDYRNLFVLSDIFASAISWSLFFIYRKLFIEAVKFGVAVPFHADFKFISGLIIIPAFWWLMYYSSGSYNDIRRKTQQQNILNLLSTTLLGVILIFFLAILDDTVISYRNYYQSVLVLFALQFVIPGIFRSAILFYKDWRFRSGKDQFKVILLGNINTIIRFTSENFIWLKRNQFDIAGYILEDMNEQSQSRFSLPVGGMESLNTFIPQLNAEEVFILSERAENDLEMQLLNLYRKNVYIRILPELYTKLHVPVKVTDFISSPLLLLSKALLPRWQQSVKTLMDMVLSIAALIVLSPLIVILVAIIKTTSPGPVIYSQTRIGKNGKPFRILKFRSMFTNSEQQGPMLAKPNDKRITPIGRFMRKRRLDEIPNFVNVLAGDMSLVGPRPERLFYINHICEKAPQYSKLHLVKPGITSWGQVKYGYAESIDEMIQRMRYDLVYIENMSLFVDIQILLKTIRIIVKGQGI